MPGLPAGFASRTSAQRLRRRLGETVGRGWCGRVLRGGAQLRLQLGDPQFQCRVLGPKHLQLGAHLYDQIHQFGVGRLRHNPIVSRPDKHRRLKRGAAPTNCCDSNLRTTRIQYLTSYPSACHQDTPILLAASTQNAGNSGLPLPKDEWPGDQDGNRQRLSGWVSEDGIPSSPPRYESHCDSNEDHEGIGFGNCADDAPWLCSGRPDASSPTFGRPHTLQVGGTGDLIRRRNLRERPVPHRLPLHFKPRTSRLYLMHASAQARFPHCVALPELVTIETARHSPSTQSIPADVKAWNR